MKQLLFAFMLLATIKSNGQDTSYYSKRRIHCFNGTVSARSFIMNTSKANNRFIADYSTYQYYPIIFSSGIKTSAYLKSGSDTLEVVDSVIELYGSKIRYIKTMNGSIIKL